MHTVIKSRVYCDTKNLIHFYVLLLQMTEFGFIHVA